MQINLWDHELSWLTSVLGLFPIGLEDGLQAVFEAGAAGETVQEPCSRLSH